jgi:hypothetical protein
MKKLLFLLLLIPFLFGCEMYVEVSDPVTYMGGGRWTFIDYDVVVTQSVSPVTILESDTICINSFNDVKEVSGGFIMKQDYNDTPISRRFIKNKTQWEFDGYNLYCEWINIPGGMQPAHEPFWVTYPNYLYTDYTHMSIEDNTMGVKTDFTFKTNNKGDAPPNELILVTPDIVASLFSSGRSYDKAVVYHIVLTFMR